MSKISVSIDAFEQDKIKQKQAQESMPSILNVFFHLVFKIAKMSIFSV